ncbi:MAG: SDR family oxidoreductase [Betaproteobacteria bacterium]|nr:SDR family oxidoreductase [Betaproteobacteria bacterium]
MKLAQRVALVTGAGNGIGKAIAAALGREGARILIADRANAASSAAELAAAGIDAHGIAVDVTNEADVLRVAELAGERFGGLDILVNNAAIFSTLVPKPLEEISAAEWRTVMDVNTLGVFLVTKAVLPLLKKSPAARIINLCSGVAFKGNPLYLHYVASKGAILSMTRALARELGTHNILVNAIAPGFTLSENVENNPALMSMVRGPSIAGRALARDMYPEDLVGAAVFFAGPDCAFITGQTLVIDGGSYFH